MNQQYAPHRGHGWPPLPPRPPRWGRFAAWVGGAAAAAFALGGGVAVLMNDDGSSVASPAACKTALAENYREAMAAGLDAPTPEAPPSCTGLDEATLKRITGEVVSEYLGSDQAKEDLRRAFEEGMESAAASP
ncbi:hypothetical protein ACFYO0_14525 [Streptomyces sp. NPDC006365]|uniref:hypothetical protein n=1 Tax=Streptomyces sp. NPDC006365 TaxID=3364744 RepID=UPI0036A16D60